MKHEPLKKMHKPISVPLRMQKIFRNKVVGLSLSK